MKLSAHWLRTPFRRDGDHDRHVIEAGQNFTVCGRFGRIHLDMDATTALPVDCPACAKALEGGHE